MGETTNQIEAHIEDTRRNLGSNLQELEEKVKSATDWRQHFQTKPMTMIGIAFGGGILLARMLSGSKYRGAYRSYATSPGKSESSGKETWSGSDHQKSKALETWDNLKGALIGVATTRLKEYVDEVIPGFHEQYQRTEEKAKHAQPPGSQPMKSAIV